MARGRPWQAKSKPSKASEKKNKQQQQQDNPPTSNPPMKQQRQSSRGGLGQNATSGNTWAGGDAAKREGKAATMPQDEHIPVNGFNAQEAREVLKQGYNVPADEKPLFYKPAGKEVNDSKLGNPWGTKPNAMANGKDFFVELRKQMHTLLQQQQAQQQANNASGG